MQSTTIPTLLGVLLLGAANTAASLELPQESLFVPWYEVDPDPSGRTTIFAIRNPSPSDAVAVDIDYWSAQAGFVWNERIDLAPQDTFARNVRHVLAHLPTDGDGLARGWIRIIGPPHSEQLVGDYFQIDPANAFAVGNALVAGPGDWCHWVEIRFLEGGAFSGGSELFIHHLPGWEPHGEPSFWIHVFDEDGNQQSMMPFFQSVGLVRLEVAALPYPDPIAFGFLRIQFNGQNMGTVTVRMDALGLYSIAMEGACVDDLMASP